MPVELSRRNFLKAAGTAALGLATGALGRVATAAEPTFTSEESISTTPTLDRARQLLDKIVKTTNEDEVGTGSTSDDEPALLTLEDGAEENNQEEIENNLEGFGPKSTGVTKYKNVLITNSAGGNVRKLPFGTGVTISIDTDGKWRRTKNLGLSVFVHVDAKNGMSGWVPKSKIWWNKPK